MLFWVTLEIIAHVLKHNQEAKFLMENVKMKKEFEEYITHHTEQALGHVEKTLINSALVSAQNRQRYYWTNFEVTQPEDKGILLRDILEDGDNERAKSQTILATIYKENAKSMVQRGKLGLIAKAGNVNPSGRGMNGNVYHVDAKSPGTNPSSTLPILILPASILSAEIYPALIFSALRFLILASPTVKSSK